MPQLNLFGPATTPKPPTVRQSRIGFRSFVDSGRRGDPNACWLDLVLQLLRDRGCPCPSLTQTQVAWDARLRASEAVEAIANGTI